MKIHVWVPDYASAMGGIQTLSRFLVRALRESFPEAQISVFVKNDSSPTQDNSGTRYYASGRWSLPMRTPIFAAQLFTKAVRERPDLIMSVHGNFAPVARWLQKLTKIPYVVIGNGIDVWEIHSNQIRHALRDADKLLAISRCTQQRMAGALALSPESIGLFPCTFDQERYIPGSKPPFLLERYGLLPDQPVILTITRLSDAEQYKGYDQIARALPAIRQQCPDVRYILGGRGSDRPRIERLINDLGVAENVILTGYIPDDELCAHYNLCDVFAMPSKGEGFGIVFLEALSCGKPVVAGNKDGSVDPLLNGELGALVDPDDVEEIAAALIAILELQKADKLKTDKLKLERAGEGERRQEKMESGESKVESGKGRGEEAEQSSICDLPSSMSGLRLPDIMFDPEALRARVIEEFGFEAFKQRLSEILEPLLTPDSK